MDPDVRVLPFAGLNLRKAQLGGLPLGCRSELQPGERGRHGCADFEGSDLTNANLYLTNLSGGSLIFANLSGAYLAGADLGGADLQRADLTGADLTGANLRGANLSSATLDGVVFPEPITQEDSQGAPLGYAAVPPGVCYNTIQSSAAPTRWPADFVPPEAPDCLLWNDR